MSTLPQLQARLAHHNRQANALLAAKGARAWSAAEQDAFDAEMDAAERVQRQIDDAQQHWNRRGEPRRLSPAQRRQQRTGFDTFLRKSEQDYSAAELMIVRNTMSTTTGSEGGFTVPTLIARELIDALKDYGSMRRNAQRIETDNGADMGWPGSDGTGEVGELVAQNATAATADPVFNSRPLTAYKFGSKVITVPIELLQDTSIDIPGFVLNRAGDRIGRAMNQSFTTGTGTGQPFGITALPAALVGATGDTGVSAFKWDLLVDLVDSMDVSYQDVGKQPNKRIGWMFSQTVRRALRKLKDSSGRPIWTPSYDRGITGSSDRLLGYPVFINNDMPQPAANAKSLAFGDFSNYMVRDVLEMGLYRFADAPFVQKGQVGFLAWARAGGNVLDPYSIRVYQHSAS